ncbi:DUF721 domain-containing protein [Candidatus Berkelbacteria bacterium]|nr:DUF721 domain-containing protein [Candidatus Berkelbacteria bacterium]
MEKRLRSLGVLEPVLAERVCAAANQVAKGQFQASKFRGGVLSVKVPNSSFAQQVQLRERTWLLQINRKLGRDLVQKIKPVLEGLGD